MEAALLKEVQRVMPHCTNLEHRDTAVRLGKQGHLSEAIAEMQLQLAANPAYAEAYAP